MEKCKYCQAELEEGSTLCPSCGKDNAEVEETMEAAAVAEETTSAEETAAPVEAASEEAAPVENEEAGASADNAEAAEAASQPEAEAAEEAAESKSVTKATPGKIVLAVAAVVVLVAVLVALIVTGMGGKKDAEVLPSEELAGTTETAAPEETVPATIPPDGEKGTITEKGSYTVTDEEAKAQADVVVAALDGRKLTNADLQVYYWMEVQGFLSQYAAYASYFGLDYTKPLDMQASMEGGGMTWQHFFLQNALSNWQQIQGMDLEAEKAGLETSAEDQEYLSNLPTIMEQNAENYSMTLDEFMTRNIGPAAGIDEFVKYQTAYRHGAAFYTAEVDKMVPTEEDLEGYFAEHEADYASSGLTKDTMLVDVRHILLTPEGGTTGENGMTTYSDEEWKACEDAAQAVLDTWLAGEKTEESFAELANKHSVDPGSNQSGGLYENVYTGQMVQAFNDWCFDESRAVGDYGMVKTEYGYHVMYFVGSHPQWKQVAEEDWVTAQINALFDGLEEKYPIAVSYDKIALGYVSVGE